MEKHEKIRKFIASILQRKGDSEPFSDDDSLLLVGRIDSLNVLEIVGFLEREFNYDVSEDLFNQENFDSVESISSLVESECNA